MRMKEIRRNILNNCKKIYNINDKLTSYNVSVERSNLEIER